MIPQVGYNGVFSLSNRFLFWQPTFFPSIRTGIRNSIAFAPFWNNIDIRSAGYYEFKKFNTKNIHRASLLSNI